MYEYKLIYEFIYILYKNFLTGTSWYTLNHMFLHEFIYEFMIFHELIYEFCHEIFARTLFGKPEFTAFHEIMPNIMDFGLFSWERSYRKSYLKNIVKNIVKI